MGCENEASEVLPDAVTGQEFSSEILNHFDHFLG